MAALEAALAYQPPESSIRAAESVHEKAKADEQRAYRVQLLREAEANEADNERQRARKQRELENQAFLRKQMADKLVVARQTKEADKVIAARLLGEVQDSIKAEEDAQARRRAERRQIALEQRAQARRKDDERNLRAGMSDTEKRFNRNLFDALGSNRPIQSTFTDTARRVFN